jgi:hypothetical protein
MENQSSILTTLDYVLSNFAEFANVEENLSVITKKEFSTEAVRKALLLLEKLPEGRDSILEVLEKFVHFVITIQKDKNTKVKVIIQQRLQDNYFATESSQGC